MPIRPKTTFPRINFLSIDYNLEPNLISLLI